MAVKYEGGFVRMSLLAVGVMAGLSACSSSEPPSTDPAERAAAAARVAPVGMVNVAGATTPAVAAPAPAAAVVEPAPAPAPVAAVVEPTPAPAESAAAEAAPAAPAAVAAAAGGNGKQTYDTVCFVCHSTGAAGAPKIGDKTAWEPRLAQGMDTLHAHSLQGFKAMPPKGGRMDLADADILAAVDYMTGMSQ